jgi:Arc/MetJ family transcription regulator
MKTTVSIDQDLVTEALTETGLVSQEEVITLGLQTLIQLKR